jgi:excisionase family DNA binding protein
MYAAIRHYQIDPARTSEVIEHVLENFVPLVRQTHGLSAYYVLDRENGQFATITICSNQEAVEKANRMAMEWIRQFLASRIMGEEELPDFSLKAEEVFQGPLYEGLSEPAYRQRLQLLSVAEVGELLGMGRSWVYQQIRSGDLASIHLGGSVKVRVEDLEEYIQKHRRFKGSEKNSS